MAEVKALCLTELEGMSKKRIRHILLGKSSQAKLKRDENSVSEIHNQVRESVWMLTVAICKNLWILAI